MNPDFFILSSEREELDPLLKYLRDITPLSHGFELAKISNKNHRECSVLLYPNGCGQSNPPAASITTEAIIKYKPRVIMLIGITGGFSENGFCVGDVVVPEFVDPYELAKRTPTEPHVDHRNPVINVNAADVIRLAKTIGASQEWSNKISTIRPDNKQRAFSLVHVPDRGVLGSGDKNIAHENAEERIYLLNTHGTRALGFEMEAAGVASACKIQGASFAVIKGIQDDGIDKDVPGHKDKWRPYAEEAAATLSALIMQEYQFDKIRLPKRTPKIKIKRLNPSHPRKIATSLLGMFKVDETFPIEDQYGLKLIELAIRQPEGFWTAQVDGKYVGYFSIYRMTNRYLYDYLVANANQGKIELPDFNEKQMSYVDKRRQNRVPKSERMHLYIDALVVKEEYRTVRGNVIANLLIDKAKSDLAEIIDRKDTIAVIAVNKNIEKLIKRKWPELRPIGEPIIKAESDRPVYRHLFVSERTSILD